MMRQKIIYITLILFGLFPITPNYLKGFPVIMLLLLSIKYYYGSRKKKLKFKKMLFFSGIYLLFLISLFYTSNFSNIGDVLTTRLSLIVIPISFTLLEASNFTLKKNDLNIFFNLFIISSTFFCSLILIKIISSGYYNDDINIGELYYILTNDFYKINQHPIYTSFFISLAIIFALKNILETDKIFFVLILIIGILLMSYILVFLSRKGVMIGLIITIFILIYRNIKERKLKFTLLTFILIFSILFSFSSVAKKRFNEMFLTRTYSQVVDFNSTSIRFVIYNCDFQLMKNFYLFGVGIGDVQTELNKCYKNKADFLTESNYNSHNQYVSYILSNGFLGFIWLFTLLILSFKKAIILKENLFFSIIIFFSIILFFENILERQSGVILFMFLICLINFNIKDDNKIEK